MSRTLIVRALAVVITIALVAWFAADARWQGVGPRLARLDLLSLVGVALLFATSYAMRGARIHGEFADEFGATGRGVVGYFRVLRLSLVHNALVNVLPFRSGEAAFPVLLSRWFGIPAGRAIISLLWLRAQDACVVLALAALAWPRVPIAVRVLALVAIVCLALGVPWWARRHRVTATNGRFAKVGALLERATRKSTAGWLWTVGNWVVKLVAEAWLLVLALDTAGDRSAAILGTIGAELASILPVQGVAGFGTFEAGAAALMRTVDVPMTTGLEAALVLHAVVLALSLIAGGLAAVLLPGPPPRP